MKFCCNRIKQIAWGILLLSMTFVFVGCGAKPEDSVNGFMNALKKYDLKTAATYMENGNQQLPVNDPSKDKFVRPLLTKVSYQILSSRVEGNQAFVKVKITAPNMPLIFSKVIGEVMPSAISGAFAGSSEAEIGKMVDEAFNKQMQKSDIDLTSNEVDIKLIKDSNSKWVIQVDENFANAITGNLTKAIKNLAQGGVNNPFAER